MQSTLLKLMLILSLAHLTAGAAENPIQAPSTWWVAGFFPIYDQAMFATGETIEHASEWNSDIALQGRELSAIRVWATETGAVDLARACGEAPYASAYAGVRVMAEKAESAPATLTASGPVRWFFNSKLVGESKEKGFLKVALPLKKGWNALLAKSWNPTNIAEWAVGCAIASASPLQWEEPAKPLASLAPIQPGTGHRNVALWSEGSKVAVSSDPLRGCAFNPKSLSMRRKTGTPTPGSLPVTMAFALIKPATAWSRGLR